MKRTISCMLIAVLIAMGSVSRAAETFDAAVRANLIAPFIEEETVAVIHVDFSRINVAEVFDEIGRLVPEAKPELPKLPVQYKIEYAVESAVERAAITEAQPGRAPVKERCLPEKAKGECDDKGPVQRKSRRTVDRDRDYGSIDTEEESVAPPPPPAPPDEGETAGQSHRDLQVSDSSPGIRVKRVSAPEF